MPNPNPTASPTAVEPLEARRLFAAAVPLGGIAVLGDSLAEEYQFSPDRSSARNFVEQLAEDRGLNFGAFDTVPRETPRNAGFAYDWALEGATTGDLIAQGQHTGAAAQAAAGEVKYAWLMVGGNDLLTALESDDPAAAAAELPGDLAANANAILQTLLASSPDLRVVVSTVPRVSILPAVRALVASGQLPQAVVDTSDEIVAGINAQIRFLAKSEPRLAVAEVDKLSDRLFAKKRYKVGKVTLDRDTPANAAQNLFLADGVHAGTIGQGLLANTFVKAMKKEFKAKLKPLTNKEILANAGLQPNGQPLVTPTATATLSSATGDLFKTDEPIL